VQSLRRKHDPARLRFLKFKHSRDEPDDDADPPSEGNTLAYKLHVSHPGHPHRLEMVFPPGIEQSLTVALWQADEQGHLVPCAPDGVFSVPPPGPGAARDTAGEPSTIRQIFWPQDRECVVTIINRRPGRPIDVSRVRVFDLGEELSADSIRGLAATAGGPPRRRRRLVGRYLHSPVLAANFGAPQFLDAAERRHIDDWQTFLLAGRRLAQFLRIEQNSGLMLAVYANGATIYPSQRVESSLQFDSGRLASNGQDPMQKDVLELILRLFDRAGLALVPELQFDAPLPELERVLHDPEESAADVLLVDREGRTRNEVEKAMGGASAGYNVLSPRVQRVVLDVLEELLERCKDHPSLAGVAFELRHTDARRAGRRKGLATRGSSISDHDRPSRMAPFSLCGSRPVSSPTGRVRRPEISRGEDHLLGTSGPVGSL
jgi:hypothetical protein